MYLLFDIGATNMRLGLSNGKKILSSKTARTPVKFNEGIKQFARMTIELNSPEKITATVGGVPGPLDPNKTKLISSLLYNWENKPLKTEIEKITKSKVFLENDAALSALGEAHYGAGKKHKIVAYLTFSTGVGGSRIVNGQLDVNHWGFEPRLQIVKHDNKFTTLGHMVSGNGLALRFKSPVEKIKNKKIWQEIEQWISVGVNNTAIYWSPDIIIIGGSVAQNKNILISRVEKFVHANLKKESTPKIAKGQLGNLSGLYGAMALLK